MHNDFRKYLLHLAVFHTMKFCATMIETAKLSPKALGQSAEQSLVPQNQRSISFYTVLTLNLRQLYCVGSIGPTLPLPPYSAGDTAPHPLPWQGGGHSLLQFHHPWLGNFSTCSRIMFPKTSVRGRFNVLPSSTPNGEIGSVYPSSLSVVVIGLGNTLYKDRIRRVL